MSELVNRCDWHFPWIDLLTCSFANLINKKHLMKRLGPFATASRRTPIHQVSLLSHARIDVHDDDNNDNDNAWQRRPLWPHRMDPINYFHVVDLCPAVIAMRPVAGDTSALRWSFVGSWTATGRLWGRSNVIAMLKHCAINGKNEGNKLKIPQTRRSADAEIARHASRLMPPKRKTLRSGFSTAN